MSTPSAPPPADTGPPAAPGPVVPYGPGPGESSDTATGTPLATVFDAESATKGFGRTALKWGIRIVLPLLLRALFRALARR